MLDNGTSLWVGDISPHMDAYFMQRAFMKAGHPCLSFKVIKDKQTQQCAGYGFANFPTLELAAKALSLLNGTLIPDSNPPTYFRLGWATHSQNSNPYSVPGYGEDFSVYVGDLSSDVTEVQLLDFFRKRYPNLRFARILYENGVSKGYGFLRFFDEAEYRHCLETMNGVSGLGNRPIKVRAGIPKKQNTCTTAASMTISQSPLLNVLPSVYDAYAYITCYGYRYDEGLKYYFSSPTVVATPVLQPAKNYKKTIQANSFSFGPYNTNVENKIYVSSRMRMFVEQTKTIWPSAVCISPAPSPFY